MAKNKSKSCVMVVLFAVLFSLGWTSDRAEKESRFPKWFPARAGVFPKTMEENTLRRRANNLFYKRKAQGKEKEYAKIIRGLRNKGNPQGSDDPTSKKQGISNAQRSFVYGGNKFALSLYKQLGKKEGNLFFSPLSISSVMAMLYAGAHGKTADDIRKVMNYGTKPEELHASFRSLINRSKALGKKSKTEFILANKIFVQRGVPLLSGYKRILKQSYDCTAENINFTNSSAAANRINRWVGKKTKNKIKNIIKKEMLGAKTRLVVANAMYFKSRWSKEFEPRRTAPRDFYIKPGETIKVPTMYQRKNFRHNSVGGVHILELPYKGGRYSMVILLPKKKYGLADLEKKLSVPLLKVWLAHLRSEKIKVYLPKFRVEWEQSLKEHLIELGMAAPFSKDKADFRGIKGKNSNRELYISDVVHKTFVEVDEKGTEAAAVTTTNLVHILERRGVFRAGHPFLFLIRNRKNGSILFIGRITDPR